MNALYASAFLTDRAAEDANGIRVSVTAHGEIVVVGVTGDLVSTTSGDLLDALVGVVTAGHKKIIVDLSDLGIMTRAGLRGLVVAAKLLQVAKGQMRIVVTEMDKGRHLLGFSFHHLIHLDRSVDAAQSALTASPGRVDGAWIAYSHAELMSLPAPSPEDRS